MSRSDPPFAPTSHRTGETPAGEDGFEIFPWTDEFQTGLPEIDAQHRRLVALLNALARRLAALGGGATLREALHEFDEYAGVHFGTEERLMRQHYPGDAWEAAHLAAHRDFIAELARLRDDAAPQPRTQDLERTVAFLTRWLLLHVLETDKRMAGMVLALQAGASLEDARARAAAEPEATATLVVQSVLGIYERLSSRSFRLMTEIAQRRRAEARLHRAQVAFDHTLEAIFVADPELRLVEVNAAFCASRERAPVQVLGRPLGEVAGWSDEGMPVARILEEVRDRGHWTGQVWYRARSGEATPEWLTLSAVRDGAEQLTHYVGVLSNVSRLLERQHHLEALAALDPLTGLPNRRMLMRRLRQELAAARRARRHLAVCFLDLDGFKAVNDRFGHAAGDALLREMAGRLQAGLRANDTVARLGGDEFALLLGEIDQPQECRATLERLLARIGQPVVLPQGETSLHASIGVTVYPQDDAEPLDLLHHADTAMYLAKKPGSGGLCFYHAGIAVD